jgi:hypothetical protein
VNLGWPFADPPDARLPVPTLERKLFSDAVATMDLHSGIDDAAEDFAGHAWLAALVRFDAPLAK